MPNTNILQKIQAELKVPKNQFNNFGKYNYRNVEDIQVALKPILGQYGYSLIISDDIVEVGGRVYIKALVKLIDSDSKEIAQTTAFAREPLSKKGMDEPQITGTASSYARKYALGGMFLLDDTKDSDSMKPGNGFISDEQAKQIRDYLDNYSIDEKGFLKYLNVDAVTQIPATNFQKAISALETKIRKIEETQNAG